jgi:DUF2934 family protein
MPHAIAEAPVLQPERVSLELTEDIIRARAYELYQQRGCEPGHGIEDRLRAEAEIVEETRYCC